MFNLDDVCGFDLENSKEMKPFLKAIRNTIKQFDIMNTVSFNAKLDPKATKQLLKDCMDKINRMMKKQSRPHHHIGYDPDPDMNLYDPSQKTNSFKKLCHMYKNGIIYVPQTKDYTYCSKYNLAKQPLAMMHLAISRGDKNIGYDHGSNIMSYCKQYSPKQAFGVGTLDISDEIK